MKFLIIAVFVVAVVARPGLVDGLLGKTGLDASVKLPAGIEVDV